MAKNIGGAARKRELSLHEIEQLQNAAFEMGVEAGREAERRLVRLATPITCPMCLLAADNEELRRRLGIKEHPHDTRGRFA